MNDPRYDPTPETPVWTPVIMPFTLYDEEGEPCSEHVVTFNKCYDDVQGYSVEVIDAPKDREQVEDAIRTELKYNGRIEFNWI